MQPYYSKRQIILLFAMSKIAVVFKNYFFDIRFLSKLHANRGIVIKIYFT